jgi:hypothetical protein
VCANAADRPAGKLDLGYSFFGALARQISERDMRAALGHRQAYDATDANRAARHQPDSS